MDRIEVRIPDGMTQAEVADTFNAYLRGHEALRDRVGRPTERPFGPYPDSGEVGRWQLDTSNDFWLRFNEDGTKGTISCRYDFQPKIVQAMVELFESRYVRR